MFSFFLMSRCKAWCFTLNNYTDVEYRKIIEWGATSDVQYLVVGRETGSSGTPHLQGYVLLDVRQRMPYLKEKIGRRAHLQPAKGSAQQNRAYCTKDGDFQESGQLPSVGQGKRSDIDTFKEWVHEYVAEHGCRPPESRVAVEHSALWLRYQSRLMSLLDHLCPSAVLVDGCLRDWQSELFDVLKEPCQDDRVIKFFYDSEGGKGKSWFCRYCVSKLGKRVQLLSIGKRDDLAHAINPECDIFMINVPRTQMEFLRYEVLESLKDRTIFSPKYQSMMKILEKNPHVIVMCNEEPDRTKMSEDRYEVTYLD